MLRHSSDRVRAHAARFLNLFLTQLAPSQVDTAVSSASGAGGISGGEPSSPVADSEDELTQVREAATSAKHAVEDALGREAGAMLMRHVELSDIQAESRLSQLASALQFFIG